MREQLLHICIIIWHIHGARLSSRITFYQFAKARKERSQRS